MQIRLLGPVEAAHAGQAVQLGAPRQRAVFAMLALAEGRTVSTDALVDGLWGEDPPSRPLGSLQVYVHGLRQALASVGLARGVLVSRAPGYALTLDGTTLDVVEFEQAWQRSRDRSRDLGSREALDSLHAALAWWRGPGLADLRAFPFAESYAARLDESEALAREDLVDLRLACGEHAAVIPEIEALVAQHPTRERRWGQLMIALYRSNRQADALAAYARARDLLAEQLGIDPGEALQQIEVGILRHDPRLADPTPAGAPRPGPGAGGDGAGAAAGSSSRGPVIRPRNELHLPRPTTTTWGRDALVADLAARIADPGLALLTLVGPGGTGKTRLATVLARRVEGFEGGRYFLEAEEGQDATALLTALGLALGGSEPAQPTTVSAASAVAEMLPPDADSLLLIDNLEVVRDAAYAVETLVKATERLTIIATSRLPLRLDFEVEVVVPPIESPRAELAARLGPAEAMACPAVALFADRARLVNQQFRVDEHNVGDVVALCRLLDGVPLALELAAARMRMLSPAAALKRLRSGLDLLSPARPALGAARTLTGTIDWSLSNLTATARSLLDDLSIFEDGFGLEAVEALAARAAGTPGEGTAPPDPVEDLGALLDCGLVHLHNTRVELRYRVLGPVRAHVRSLGIDPERQTALRLLHLAWMSRRLGPWSAALDGPDGDVALARFDDEHADLVSLIDWALARHAVADAAALAADAAAYWLASGRVREGLDRLGLFDLTTMPPALRCRLEIGIARLAYQAGDFARAERMCRSVLSVADVPVEHEAAAHCYLAAAIVAEAGPGEEAERAARTALRLARERGEGDVHAVTLSVIAIAAAMAGDLELERRCYEERLLVARSRGDRARIADTLNTLAEIALDEPRDLLSARDYVAEALRLAGEHRPMERRDGLITAARISVLAGEADRAAVELSEALDLSSRTGQPHGAAQAARVAACLLVRCGDHRAAVRLFTAADELSPGGDDGGEPFEADLRAALRTAREALDETQVARLRSLAAVDLASVIAESRRAILTVSGRA
ncbi:MAG TPA: BTAD domain-containing putative transcriptional regulator [Intrasporangium sp.]|uniref:AfsR/SARP family transcriptional regulator n=1 Tax=Intrasporangium sp. TaxID=1925024 RepID=UPI002D789372|nr:BTAD domain-containing putative transcriptional regulator [Intrasporangium sp.]HET7398905.1 BTAD domain-containing putative transcriptional regulator [Intrasporangium sp.]